MKIVFLGGGNMSGAVIEGLLAQGVAAGELAVMDRHPEKLARFAERGVGTHATPGAWIAEGQVVVLGVKPQGLQACLKEAAAFINDQAVVLSMAAGVTVDALQAWCGTQRIVRAMPNTPAKVGKGFTGLFARALVSDEDKARAERVMSAVGRCAWVSEENMLHAITAGTGSGPAYVFLFMQSLAEALERQGLDKELAKELALSTVEGAAALARQSNESFAQLRANVTSRGGTTAQAIAVFESEHWPEIIDKAAQACAECSKQMSQMFAEH